jgi:hypothetical protein
MKRLYCVTLLVALVALPMRSADAPATLDNQAILLMKAWHMNDAEIVATINRNSAQFDLTAPAIKALKDEGVSNAVLEAMWKGNLKSAQIATAAVPAPAQIPVAPARAVGSAAGNLKTATPVSYPDDTEPPATCLAFPPISFDKSILADNTKIPMGPSQIDLNKMVRLNATGSGGEIYTKSIVYVAYVNRLRYSVSLGGVVTAIAAPTVPFAQMFTTTPLTPAAASTTQKSTLKVGGTEKGPGRSKEDDDHFKRFSECYNHLATTLADFQVSLGAEELLLNNTRLRVNAATSNLQPVVETAEEARAAADLSIFPKHESPAFPVDDLSSLKKLVTQFQGKYAKLSVWVHAPGNEDLVAEFDRVEAGSDAMSSRLDQYLESADTAANAQNSGKKTAKNGSDAAESDGSIKSEAANYDATRIYVDNWRQIFRTVAGANDDYFVVTYQPTCGGFFGAGTSTQMQMTVADSLHPPASGTKVTPTNLDKVVCQPTISISNGLGLSFIPSQTPAFVPAIKQDAQGNPVPDSGGNPTIVQSLGYSNQSSVSAGYALQANASLWATQQWGFELHWSVGAMLTASSAGATTDIVTGPSFSFRRRTFFVSPMYDLGLRTVYVSPFQVGMPQGNLTSPPTQQVWKSGFAVTITFPFTGGTKNVDSSGGGATANTTGKTDSGKKSGDKN